MKSKQPFFSTFLDSGAFSVWTDNKTIPIDAYCDFIKEHEDILTCYAGLDVIPGEWHKKQVGKTKVQEVIFPGGLAAARAEAAEKSFMNLRYMRTRGLKPIPVFHVGEPWHHLIRLVDSGYDYIALGSMARMPANKREQWLDDCFNLLCNSAGWPIVKIHGFAVTSQRLILKYPWYSVDSASWALCGGYGRIYVPHKTSDGFNFQAPPPSIAVADGLKKHVNKGAPSLLRDVDPQRWKEMEGIRVASLTEKKGSNYRNRPAEVKRWVDEYIEWSGYDLVQILSNPYGRYAINATYFQNLAKFKKQCPLSAKLLDRQDGFIRRLPTLADKDDRPVAVDPDSKIIIYLVPFYSPTFIDVLRVAGIKDMLVSYHYVQGPNEKQFRKVITTGEWKVSPDAANKSSYGDIQCVRLR